MDTNMLWLIITGMGIITLLHRISFIVLLGDTETPPLLQRALRYVPAAVLTALFVPALLFYQGTLNVSAGNERLLAGVVAIIVARLTKSILLTIGVGMVVLWVLQVIF
jgi:branched-subunit amino acid transport protein